MERQGRGGPVQARVEGRRREDAWDHHGPGLKREKSGGTPCGGWERITVNAANSSALSLWGEEFYRSLPPPPRPGPSARGLTASTMRLNKVLHMGRFHAASPGPLIGQRTQFMIALDFISKQHTMSSTQKRLGHQFCMLTTFLSICFVWRRRAA